MAFKERPEIQVRDQKQGIGLCPEETIGLSPFPCLPVPKAGIPLPYIPGKALRQKSLGHNPFLFAHVPFYPFQKILERNTSLATNRKGLSPLDRNSIVAFSTTAECFWISHYSFMDLSHTTTVFFF